MISYSVLTDNFFNIITDSAIHERSGKLAIICFEPVHDLIILLVFGTGIKELFILLMLVDHIKHAFVGAISPVKTFLFRYRMNF